MTIPDWAWIPEPIWCWFMNRRIKRLCARHPDKFIIVDKEDGLLIYEHTPWWRYRRMLEGFDDAALPH